MNLDVKFIHYLISISWRRPLNPCATSGSAQVPLAPGCKCTITPAYHFNADVPGRSRFGVSQLSVMSVRIETRVYCFFFFSNKHSSLRMKRVYRLQRRQHMNGSVVICEWVYMFSYMDMCVNAQSLVPLCLCVLYCLLETRISCRDLAVLHVSWYWLYEWWSYLPVEWMAALTNDCLILRFLNSPFCKDGWRKLKGTKMEEEVSTDEKCVIMKTSTNPWWGVFVTANNCVLVHTHPPPSFAVPILNILLS